MNTAYGKGAKIHGVMSALGKKARVPGVAPHPMNETAKTMIKSKMAMGKGMMGKGGCGPKKK